ncbi:response regulator transcription factor [Scandinavium goeteborgense]|uniref:Response regulator receiver domain-containing protein n=1 Tax=Scandinavium goeteborgense TaxID=1851514 RepID=A0A4R6EYN9_SCAGO|nr:response regulator [Scandinavium goeteborgense]TDN64462.1 response regulator receiver domain-containing protein [Scandinavium goeteborgense]
MQLPQRIAIVDDEPAVRSGLSNLLQSDGYSTRVYESAEAYLAEKNALIESSLIIIDIKLKGMSGFELYEKIKTFPLPPPVIFISGHGDENMQRFAIQLGAVAFLRKPIDIDVLLKHLQHAVRPEKNNASEP